MYQCDSPVAFIVGRSVMGNIIDVYSYIGGHVSNRLDIYIYIMYTYVWM